MKQILLFRNLVDSVPKNAGLYLVGVLSLLFYKQMFELGTIVFGLIAFLITYSSVYVFNDLMDVEDDKQNYEVLDRKPLAQGTVKKRDAVKIGVLFLVIGLLFSVLINFLFFMIMCGLLFLNGIYSYPIKRKKVTTHLGIDSEMDSLRNVSENSVLKMKSTSLGLPLIFSIQFLKIFIPWTTTSNILGFPLLLAVGFSLIYIVMFRGYKQKKTVGASITENWLLVLITISMFICALVVHSETHMQMILYGFMLGAIALFWRLQFTSKKFRVLGSLYIVIAIPIILSAYLFISGN